jgi:hypothetical protein
MTAVVDGVVPFTLLPARWGSSRDRQTDGSPRRVVREKDPMLKMRNNGNGSKSSKEQEEEEAQRKKQLARLAQK